MQETSVPQYFYNCKLQLTSVDLRLCLPSGINRSVGMSGSAGGKSCGTLSNSWSLLLSHREDKGKTDVRITFEPSLLFGDKVISAKTEKMMTTQVASCWRANNLCCETRREHS